MAKYGVYVSFVRSVVMEVEAKDAKEAVAKVLNGEGEEFGDYSEELIKDSEYTVIEEYSGHEEEVRVDD